MFDLVPGKNDGRETKRPIPIDFIALDAKPYVLLRVGAGDETFPDELVVFPQSSEGELQSSAAAASNFAALLIVALFASALQD